MLQVNKYIRTMLLSRIWTYNRHFVEVNNLYLGLGKKFFTKMKWDYINITNSSVKL